MNPLVPWIVLAGVVHLAIVAANFALPRRLRVKENIACLPPLLRQVFIVHWVYIVIVLLILAGLCLGFPDDLAGGSPLGRFLSAAIAVFWLLRIVLQFVYYDRETRRQNRLLDAAYTLALAYFVLVFGAAAMGWGQ